MATEQELSIAYTRKVQLDEFEPVTCFAEATVELEDGDDIDDVYDDYAERVEDMVERKLAARVTLSNMEDSDDE